VRIELCTARAFRQVSDRVLEYWTDAGRRLTRQSESNVTLAPAGRSSDAKIKPNDLTS